MILAALQRLAVLLVLSASLRLAGNASLHFVRRSKSNTVALSNDVIPWRGPQLFLATFACSPSCRVARKTFNAAAQIKPEIFRSRKLRFSLIL